MVKKTEQTVATDPKLSPQAFPRKDRQVFNCEKQEGKKTYRFLFFTYFVTFVVKILALTINMNG
jgi:hypothetical protein